jgi:enoyl-[acyl-carrier-protein] reductase (NADH)
LPGAVFTERQLRLWITPEMRAQIARDQCLPGELQADDVSAMALFLAADDSRMCTGQDFIVDAGMA